MFRVYYLDNPMHPVCSLAGTGLGVDVPPEQALQLQVFHNASPPVESPSVEIAGNESKCATVTGLFI